MIPARPRLRVVTLVVAAFTVAAAFAAVGGASTSATAPTNTTLPAVSGTAKQGSTLTSTSGSWSGTTPISFTYKWFSCNTSGTSCNLISSGSSTYVLQAAEVGHRIRSQVVATNSAGSATALSNPTGTVASAGSAPTNSAHPAISGAAKVGSTLTATNGTWSGTTPITYTYNWLRCDAAGNNCASIGLHSDNQTYVLTSAEAGKTVRVVVTATNVAGQAQATSSPSAVVAAGGPVNTAAPTVTGSANVGSTLTSSTGTWTSSTTITYTYQWQRCDTAGNNCAAISGATSATYVLAAADGGKTMRAVVKATNSTGSTTASSAAVGPIATGPALPPGAIKLPDGEISVPASSIPSTDRLVASSVKYTPAAIHAHGPVTITVKVVDLNKYVVSGALLYVLPIPSNWAQKTAEVQTAQDGTAHVLITPTSKAPTKGSLVLFLRARTPQGDLLAGSSTRRLVSVRIFPS